MAKRTGSTRASLFELSDALADVDVREAKRAIAIAARCRIAELGITKTALAERMHTGRTQIERILDADDVGTTLRVLFRLARALGMSAQVSLVTEPSSPESVGRRRVPVRRTGRSRR